MAGAGIVVREKLPGLLARNRAAVFPSAWHGRNVMATSPRVNLGKHRIWTRLHQRDKPYGQFAQCLPPPWLNPNCLSLTSSAGANALPTPSATQFHSGELRTRSDRFDWTGLSRWYDIRSESRTLGCIEHACKPPGSATDRRKLADLARIRHQCREQVKSLAARASPDYCLPDAGRLPKHW